MPFVLNEGIRIHYEVEGDGPALVLHHGVAQSLRGWYDMGYVAALKSRYRLILLDARGHGASDKPHEPSAYVIERQAGDVIAVLDTLGVAQADYFGFSMGGRIGFTLAANAPRRLRSMIIVGASPYAISDAAHAEWLGYLRGGMPGFVCWCEAFGAVPAAIKDVMLANDVEALVALWLARREAPALESLLPTMAMPCLLFAGDRDGVFRRAKDAAAAMPNAAFVALPGLNHGDSFYRSDLVLPHVDAFLTEPRHAHV